MGTVESFKTGFPYAALYYRGIQRDVAFHISNDFNWDDKIILSDLAISDLHWWISCPVPLPAKSLTLFIPDMIITTDSSESVWGATSSNGVETYGFWTYKESFLHINVLETLAIYFAFLSLLRNVSNLSIKIKSDSTTAIAYVNNLGGVKSPKICNTIFDIYDFCIKKNLRIEASHISGRLNTRADALSRKVRVHSYSLPQNIFSLICKKFDFVPNIDLFASRDNSKMPIYFSEGPDPFALEFDAFQHNWPSKVYAFPPIHLVDKFIY